MQWLSDLPFADNRVLQIGFLLACAIAALIVLAVFYRLAFAQRLRVPGGRTRQPRLGLVDAFSLDGQRQLVLVRRDNVEHLIMIGGPNDVLLESQINRAVVPARENSQASPLLVPSTPVRRAEVAAAAPPTAAEAPAKVAAKAPASPPAPALAQPPAPPPTQPPAPAPAQPPASAAASSAAPAAVTSSAPPKAPAPVQAPAPPAQSAPPQPAPKPITPERARPAPAPSPAAQAGEPPPPPPPR
jgi:flagellar protein FliO/FliZ